MSTRTGSVTRIGSTPGIGGSTARSGCRLRAEHLVVGYGGAPVLDDVSVEIPDGELTVVVGPNACGKSTLLKALARMLPLAGGQVYLDDAPLKALAPKQIARVLGLLPQAPQAPAGISVSDLVSRGRYPHQSLLRQWSPADAAAVMDAMLAANVGELADRSLDTLSGGQRQRVWIAMTLAQQTPLVLLDEPTTYLDIAHQIEVLELTRELQRSGRTVVAVLHELHLAFRYGSHLIVMRDGRILAEGRPAEIVTEALIEEAFDLPCRVISDPVSETPMVIPLGPAGCRDAARSVRS